MFQTWKKQQSQEKLWNSDDISTLSFLESLRHFLPWTWNLVTIAESSIRWMVSPGLRRGPFPTPLGSQTQPLSESLLCKSSSFYSVLYIVEFEHLTFYSFLLRGLSFSGRKLTHCRSLYPDCGSIWACCHGVPSGCHHFYGNVVCLWTCSLCFTAQTSGVSTESSMCLQSTFKITRFYLKSPSP